MNIFSFIKSRIPITDVVHDYVTLKKAGLYWKGPCPFHHERTPSFTVSPHRDIFYCFGCHKGGDVIAFIAHAEHCTPLEAVRHLADRYNVALPEKWDQDSGGENKTEKLRRYTTLCTHFAAWCHKKLLADSAACAYLRNRGFSDQSMKTFMLGYFPEKDLDLLFEALSKEGFLAHDLQEAHIIAKGRSGWYSSLTERIIFPIQDYLGRVCGFGGRVFRADDQRPKYSNSQDHPFFSKGQLLYGLDKAKKALQEEQKAFLVEGYLDCIAMVQAGYCNTIATLGTACTLEHLKLIARYTPSLYTLYDGDAAGQQAILKLARLAWQANLELFVVSLPEEEDPASFLLKKKNLDELITQAQDIFLFTIGRLGASYQTKSMQERIALVQELVDTIALVDDSLKQNLLLAKAAVTFDIPLNILTAGILKAQRNGYSEISTAAPVPADARITIPPLEQKLIASLLKKPVALDDEDYELIQRTCIPSIALLVEKILIYNKSRGLDELSDFLTTLLPEEQEIVVKLIIEEDEQSPLELAGLLSLLWKKEWKLITGTLKSRLKKAEESHDFQAIQLITNEFGELKKKMKDKGII